MTTIRPAEPDDLPAILSIYAHAVTSGLATWDEDVPSLAEMARRVAARTEAGFPILVAEIEGGGVVGYASGGPFHPQSGWRYTIEHSIYVADGHRRGGIGRSLLEALIEEASRRGFRQMIAGISLPGGEASVAFHAALGFRKVGELAQTGWKHGQWLSAVYMQRPLGQGSGTRPDGEGGVAPA